MRIHCCFIVIAFVTTCSGCGDHSQDNSGSLSFSRPATPHDGLTLAVTINSPDSPDTQQKSIVNPDEQTIRDQFSAIHWQDPEVSASLVLSQSTPFHRNIGVKGNLAKGLFATWSEQRSADANWSYFYSEAVSESDALELLVSAVGGDESFQTVVQWQEELDE